MPTPFNTPQPCSTILIHSGNLQVNQVDGGTTPTEYNFITSTVYWPQPETIQLGDSTAFTAFDAGVLQAASYDEIVVNVLPTITVSDNSLSISTTNSLEAYRQVAATGRPFWFFITMSGYGQPTYYASASQALSLALSVQAKLYGDVVNLKITPNFRGFAFRNADLNNVYLDGSSITRQMQNQLVQSCWALGVSACFITARPADYTTLIGPNLLGNINSGVAMDPPILGCNPASMDKLVVTYPNIQESGINMSVVVGQVAALLENNNQDPGFTPNYEVAYVVIVDDTFLSADGTMGATFSGAFGTLMANVWNFACACGLGQVGVFNTSYWNSFNATVNFPPPQGFLPQVVNTTGQCRLYGTGNSVFVTYSDGAGGVVKRTFSSTFVES